MRNLAARIRLGLASAQKNGIFKTICTHTLTQSEHETYTLSDAEQEYPDHWADKGLALPWDTYRAGGKAVISTAIWRLSKNKTSIIRPTNLFTNFEEDLERCKTSRELILKTKQQLGLLFPDIAEDPNRKIREDFFKESNMLLEDDKKIKENLEILQNLADHPLLKSIEGRTALVYFSAQIYRNFTHQLRELDEKLGPIPLQFDHEERMWQKHYHDVVYEVDASRLDPYPPPFSPQDFPKFGFAMATMLNKTRDCLLDIEKTTRAGHVMIFKRVMDHANGRFSVRKLDREVIMENLNRCMGPVVVDVKDYNRRTLPKEFDFSIYYC